MKYAKKNSVTHFVNMGILLRHIGSCKNKMNDIVEQLHKVGNQVFQITSNLRANRDMTNGVNCPRCKHRRMSATFDHRVSKIQCNNCYWTEYYLRIEKND